MGSFDLKLQRAREHLETFQQEANTWIESEPYGIVDEADPDPSPEQLSHVGGHHRLFRVSRVDVVTDRLNLLIGDCVHNLRSTLDHIVFALARTNTPNLTHKQVIGSEFPVFGDKIMTGKQETAKIGCLSPGAQAAIKGLQPYQRGTLYQTHPLWQIHDLDRIDKHRHLTLCVSVPRRGNPGDEDYYVGFKHPGLENWNVQDLPVFISAAGEMKVDAVFARYSAIPIDSHREVKLNPVLPLNVAFAKGGPADGETVTIVLQALCDFVGNVVISQLAKFL
jgi:hypothetical protein